MNDKIFCKKKKDFDFFSFLCGCCVLASFSRHFIDSNEGLDKMTMKSINVTRCVS